MSVSETIRPNGKVYKRRKPLEAVTLTWNEYSTIVMVYGTHDAELAHDLALAEWQREGLEGDLPKPTKHWIKIVPWDALGLGYARTVLDVDGNTRGSTPALQYGGDDW